MTGYNEKLALSYSKKRDKYTSTDDYLFYSLNKIGITGKKILDFGCGDGRYGIELIKLGASELKGIDLSKKMIQLANKSKEKENFSNIEFLVADGNNIPFEDQYFDIVIANFVLVHFLELDKPFKEIFRVLKNNGNFICLTNNVDYIEKSVKNKPISIKLGSTEDVIVKDFLKTDEETRLLLTNTGFKIDVYESISNTDASVDTEDPSYNKIKGFHCVLFVASK